VQSIDYKGAVPVKSSNCWGYGGSVKVEGPGFWPGPAVFVRWFYFIKLDITNTPIILTFCLLMGFGLRVLGWGWGLDKDFVGEIGFCVFM
jgi:hypothetical protein